MARLCPRRMAREVYLDLKTEGVRLAAWAHSHSRRRTYRFPFRVRPVLRLPADSLLPGQMPTHEANLSALPKAVISVPISTSNMAAPMMSMPGRVQSSCSTGRSSSKPSSNWASNLSCVLPVPQCGASTQSTRRYDTHSVLPAGHQIFPCAVPVGVCRRIATPHGAIGLQSAP